MNLVKTEPILCIDPGTFESGVVLFDGQNVLFSESSYDNDLLVSNLINKGDFAFMGTAKHMVIEGIQSYGMAVGETTFETCEWIGRFRQAFGYQSTTKLFRKDIKLFLCGSMRAKGPNIRQRILDIFPATGGGKTPQVGIKKQPGPLFGISSHAFSALAIGLTHKYCNNK